MSYDDQEPFGSVFLHDLERGDKSCWESLVATCWSRMVCCARRFNDATAEDVAQEVLMKFWHRRPQLAEGLRQRGINYLVTAVWLKCNDDYRRRKRRNELNPIGDPSLVATTTGSPVDQLILNEHQAILDKMIELLPPRQRDVVRYRLEGWGNGEIASLLDISEPTASSAYSKAIQSLRAEHGLD
ncbi:MAG: sigma-70 family RNA polymerase sigma factor [Pirellulales bacterium]|jgi:RNA polymerase sigma factor (sigma-70 family)